MNAPAATPTNEIRNALSYTLTCANGKGGVGKTSVCANLAGIAAQSGWKVLVIDLDPQGDLGDDLGYRAESDEGEHLAQALTGAVPLQPVLTDVRPNLDVIPGGYVLDDVEVRVVADALRGKTPKTMFVNVLAPLAAQYDMVLIDTPPTRPTLMQLALGVSRWVIVPTKSDRASIRGLGVLAREMQDVRETNPDIDILGVCLFGVSSTATRVRANALEDLESALGGVAPVFDSVIRHSESTAQAARELNQLVFEAAIEAENAEPFWKALQEGREVPRHSRTTKSVAEDYISLATEVINALSAEKGAEANG